MRYGLLVAAAFAASLLQGCSAMPSIQYCHDVVYERHGLDVKMTATCTVPAGGIPGAGL